jgi:protein-disulfide isomerase
MPAAPSSSSVRPMLLSRRSLTRRARIASVVAVAALGSCGLIAASAAGARSEGTAKAAPAAPAKAGADIELIGVKDVNELFKGIPQAGGWLGTDKAPIQMVLFADLQCPYCKQYDVEVNPTVVREFVRTGKVRLFYSGMDFIGKDSNRGLKAAAAAANQNKLWQLVTLLFINQGAENGGWLSDKMLTTVAKAIPGLDVKKFDKERKSKAVDKRMAEWASLASSAGVSSTPTFFAGTKGKLGSLAVTSLDVAQFRTALTKLVNAK